MKSTPIFYVCLVLSIIFVCVDSVFAGDSVTAGVNNSPKINIAIKQTLNQKQISVICFRFKTAI